MKEREETESTDGGGLLTSWASKQNFCRSERLSMRACFESQSFGFTSASAGITCGYTLNDSATAAGPITNKHTAESRNRQRRPRFGKSRSNPRANACRISYIDGM